MLNTRKKDNGALLALIISEAEQLHQNLTADGYCLHGFKDIVAYAQALESRQSFQSIRNHKE